MTTQVHPGLMRPVLEHPGAILPAETLNRRILHIEVGVGLPPSDEDLLALCATFNNQECPKVAQV